MGKLEEELPRHLSYHNIDHTIDVMRSAEFIACNENIGDGERELLLTAALLHDTGFLTLRDGHEVESCKIAHYYLPLYNYLPAEIDTICGLIMATRIPQSPGNKLEEILCDADLDYLGRDDFFALSTRLFNELRAEGLVKDQEEWDRQQADFMGDHHYFTATPIKLLDPKKKQYVELIKSKISTGNLR